MNSELQSQAAGFPAPPAPPPGKLKIFLGMCAGVGKTFAMLQVAQRELDAGRDVVVGWVETHGRTETQELLDRLPFHPRRTLSHRGVMLQELDLDGLLVRRPSLVVVDELAHTNAPGSRHTKRWQDVRELLDSGISVLTALNVQHLESRSDVVREITGVDVRETVPDSVLELADEIQLVDITPADLRLRLETGKVYLGENARAAARNFFREENLAALREIALRVAAEHTGDVLREAMRDRGIGGPWKADDRLLVSVGPSPHSEGLIRWTRRMAGALNASWMAVSVETDDPLAPADLARLTRHLSLARSLGAEVLTIPGADPVETLLRLAREQNVTQIVVGKSLVPPWRNWLTGGSFPRRLIRKSGRIDVCVVQTELPGGLAKSPARATPATPDGHTGMAAAVVGTALLTVLFLGLARFIGHAAVAPLYLLWIVVAGLRFPRRVVLAVAVLSALLWNFLFIPPVHSFSIGSFHDVAMYAVFMGVALAVGNLTYRLKRAEVEERKRERRTAALLEMARSTALTLEPGLGLEAAVALVAKLLHSQVALTLRTRQRELSPLPVPGSTLELTEKERGVAEWAFGRKLTAGRFTDTLPDAAALHLPLTGCAGVYGVLSVRPLDDHGYALGERDLLEALASLMASILEKEHLIESMREMEVLAASEDLQRALLDSVSHEIKTPLAALRTGVDALSLHLPDLSPAAAEVMQEIRRALRRLQRVIENLLDMSRIQARAVKLRLDWVEVPELVEAARALVGDALEAHIVEEELPTNLPMVRVDRALVEQCLANLLLNAAAWGPPGSPVTVRAAEADGWLVLSVLDRGPGLKPGDERRVFEKFYRSPGSPAGGAGLGLSIVKGFAQAHGGTVDAANRPEGGACFQLRLPIGEPPSEWSASP